MKILQRVNRKVGDKVYMKYGINIPNKIVEELGLLDKELVVKKIGKKIVIEEK